MRKFFFLIPALVLSMMMGATVPTITIDGNKSELAEPFTLHAVVHNVTQAVERTASSQFLLRLLDGGRHAKAESAAIVNLNL